ncbi:hypothetical protein [Acetivibrio cellulolyticus]|uniref:hypothetical protein n=1 Tax=Acetivibrio cellulolyticus TaxID=35830 RepID=UPI0001E2FBC9|nr:hypothetical protein [Acetivibrio cellulolyticus]
MSEATFKKHLAELDGVLSLLQGDIESGPDDVVQDWYDQTLDVIYKYEDEIDSNLYVRLGMDEDSIEDGEILEDENAEELETEEYEEEIVDSSDELDEAAEEDAADGTAVFQIEDIENAKAITINIKLPNPW